MSWHQLPDSKPEIFRLNIEFSYQNPIFFLKTCIKPKVVDKSSYIFFHALVCVSADGFSA